MQEKMASEREKFLQKYLTRLENERPKTKPKGKKYKGGVGERDNSVVFWSQFRKTLEKFLAYGIQLKIGRKGGSIWMVGEGQD